METDRYIRKAVTAQRRRNRGNTEDQRGRSRWIKRQERKWRGTRETERGHGNRI